MNYGKCAQVLCKLRYFEPEGNKFEGEKERLHKVKSP